MSSHCPSGVPVADEFVVAVLDTGCFIHQDFIDGFDIENSRFWVNKGETDCENKIDDDGNGYIDDCFGWVGAVSVGADHREIQAKLFLLNKAFEPAGPASCSSKHSRISEQMRTEPESGLTTL